jgi:hypothetical protein
LIQAANTDLRFDQHWRTQLLVFAAVIWLASAESAEQDDRYEMWEEPSHQLVFVDGPARVLDVRIVPGVTSDFHKHRFATTYVVIQDALVANQYWEAEWSASGPRDYRGPGVTVDNANYVEKPYYHRVRNEDQRTFHVVAVINEHPASNLPAPDDAVNKGEIDNAWFREHRIPVASGSNSGTLKFDNDVALFQSVAGSSHILENGIAHSFKGAPGAFSWHRAGSGFRIANRSEEEMEFILIEVKK